MTKIMVTGATGFVGQSLCQVLRQRDIGFVPMVRRQTSMFHNAAVIQDINAATDWQPHLAGVDVVVHLAARVHILNDASSDRLRDYRAANVDATLNLARQCVAAGVKRFVYLSSIKVNGEQTTARPFSAADTPCPEDPYGISKLEAEQGLQQLASETGLEVVILRPPLVYGPGVKANFLQLLRWIRRGIPLPFASVHNRRDMVYLGNLVDLIIHCTHHPAAAGHTFLMSDGRSVSTADLIRTIALAMHKKPALFPAPPAALLFAAKLLGKEAVAIRLLGSLQVDIRHTIETLDWRPPYSFEYGIEQTVKHFLDAGFSPSVKRNEKTL